LPICTILGGLNEGTWPAEPQPDPWLSRPMRAQFGLPRWNGGSALAAHDYRPGSMAPEVVVTRAVRAEGAPTVPARWLLRLDALLTALGAPASWLAHLRLKLGRRPRPAGGTLSPISPPASVSACGDAPAQAQRDTDQHLDGRSLRESMRARSCA
jgi:ATP-dependent helicase/nuclease subunit B